MVGGSLAPPPPSSPIAHKTNWLRRDADVCKVGPPLLSPPVASLSVRHLRSAFGARPACPQISKQKQSDNTAVTPTDPPVCRANLSAIVVDSSLSEQEPNSALTVQQYFSLAFTMNFVLFVLLCVATAVTSEQSVYRTAFDTGVLLANEPEEIQGPKTCENDCARALQVEMVIQGITFDENLLSALNDSTKFDSICRSYGQQLTTCFPKCAQKPANAVVALLQLICVDKRQALDKNIDCAAQMESTMTEMCVNNCLRRKHSAERNPLLAMRQQDTCTRSHCVIKCLGAQITECDLNEMKGVYELLSGAQMLIGFQLESAPEQTGERLKSTDVPAKCRSLMQASHSVMRNVVITQNSEDDISHEIVDLENLKLQKELQVLDKEAKKLDLEIQKLRLQ